MPAIDLVSPLPPVRSGIADYCADLLPHLAERCDLRLVHLPGQPVDPAIAGRYPLIELDEAGAGGRLPLYQMGNNPWHLEIWKKALERPGVLTLHDLVLHHFLIERTVKHHDFDGYRQALAEDHGWIGEAAGRPIRWPGGSGRASQFSLPAHHSLLSRQIGVLTHSSWAAEILAEELPGLRVRCLPMGVPLVPPADPTAGAAFRRRHGLPVAAPLIGAFGFQTPMKRTEVLIDALQDPALAGVHLMVAGEVSPIYGLANYARLVGVEERVHFLGYLPFEEWEAGIAAVDLCLNLRYPTAGETSASLLRILAVGKVAIVSDYAQSADLPDAVVVKVPVGDGERQVLIEKVAELLGDRRKLRLLEEEARRYVAHEHRLEDSAAAMVAACEEWAHLAPLFPDCRGGACRPPSSLTRHPLSIGLELEGIDTPWQPGQRRKLRFRVENRSEAYFPPGELAGGFSLEVQLLAGGRDLRAGEPWLPLPRELPAGGSFDFALELRRPLDAEVELRLVPHLAADAFFDVHPRLETLSRAFPV
jgi:glycosyltransferase involved in cell wall biosynthesis